MFVVYKSNKECRLIYDMSALTKHESYSTLPFILSPFDKVLDEIEKHDFAIKVYLRNGFYRIPL